MSARALSLLAVLFFFVSTAVAQTTIALTGSVTSIFNNGTASAPASVHTGDAVTTTIIYGAPTSSQTYPTYPTINGAQYTFSSFTFSVVIGSLTWSYVSGSIILENDQPTLGRDRFTISGSGTPTSFPGQLSFTSMSVNLFDNTLPTTELPGYTLADLEYIDFSASTSRQGIINTSANVNDSFSVIWTPSSLSVVAVPEPATTAFIVGIVALGIIAIKRRSR